METDLGPLNLGLATAQRRPQDRTALRLYTRATRGNGNVHDKFLKEKEHLGHEGATEAEHSYM